jgi:HSP20 family protein
MAIGDLIPRRTSTPVAPRDGYYPLMSLHRQMERLFDDFWRDFDLPVSTTSRGFGWPQIDVSETDKELKVQAELPGVDEKDVEVMLNNGMLTIRGEKKTEAEDKARRISERYYGRFERELALPFDVQEDKVAAKFNNGVLTITLPKSEQATQKAKRIEIKH